MLDQDSVQLRPQYGSGSVTLSYMLSVEPGAGSKVPIMWCDPRGFGIAGTSLIDVHEFGECLNIQLGQGEGYLHPSWLGTRLHAQLDANPKRSYVLRLHLIRGAG